MNFYVWIYQLTGGKATIYLIRICSFNKILYVYLIIMKHFKVYCFHQLYSTNSWKDNLIQNIF